MKHVLPPGLLFLLLNLGLAQTEDGRYAFGGYEGYPWTHQAFGMAIALFALLLVLVGALCPRLLSRTLYNVMLYSIIFYDMILWYSIV